VRPHRTRPVTLDTLSVPPHDAAMLVPGGQHEWSIVGSSLAVERLRDRVARFAAAEAPVLVTGETGTGKELVARALHDRSDRFKKPFLAVNCSAIPPTLFESQLFGYERGAFTGAERVTRGFLEVAGAGTLFLDEVGDLPLDVQPKLLRVFETRRFFRVGGHAELAFNARIVSATNADLRERVRRGLLREDLLYRLRVLRVRVPPLRERFEDIQDIIRSMFPGRSFEFTPKGATLLRRYPWPGNVRELRNVIEYVTASLAGERLIEEGLLREALDDDAPTEGDEYDAICTRLLALRGSWFQKLVRIEHGVFDQALHRCHYNATAAARLLGIDRKVVTRRVEKLRLRRPGNRVEDLSADQAAEPNDDSRMLGLGTE
jgi:transcriptional regulator with PAS, ATPase and Fis domain